jgi:hypothetical protein
VRVRSSEGNQLRFVLYSTEQSPCELLLLLLLLFDVSPVRCRCCRVNDMDQWAVETLCLSIDLRGHLLDQAVHRYVRVLRSPSFLFSIVMRTTARTHELVRALRARQVHH